MTLIIKGLDMPQSCRRCKFCVDMNDYPFSACFLTDEDIPFETDRLEDCPLIEINDDSLTDILTTEILKEISNERID